jgi:hypothetical protein
MPAAERRRWSGEAERRRCNVARWERNGERGLWYVLPQSEDWEMRIDCLRGSVQIAGAGGLNFPDGGMMRFHTSRGWQRRPIRMTDDYLLVAPAFRPRPGDEVLQALMRGETIGVGYDHDEAGGAEGAVTPIDGGTAPPLLRPVLANCHGWLLNPRVRS